MKVKVSSTRIGGGYWFKAPSWETGQHFGAEPVEIEMPDADLADLKRLIAEGHPLKFELGEKAQAEKSSESLELDDQPKKRGK